MLYRNVNTKGTTFEVRVNSNTFSLYVPTRDSLARQV